MPRRTHMHRIAAAATALAVSGLGAVASQSGAATDRAKLQTTDLMSRDRDGGVPNGPSTNAVISGDKRYSKLIAYESLASDIAGSDSNGVKDVFVIKRGGSYTNDGSRWRIGKTYLVSRGLDGRAANGPSWGAAVDGDFDHLAHCVAFLSSASNLVKGDTNGKVDAFLVTSPGGAPRRVSLPGNRQSSDDTTQVDVSGDCSRTAFVIGGTLYMRSGSTTRKIASKRPVSDPAFAEGRTTDLVFGAPGGAYRLRAGTGTPTLVAPGGRNPVFNNIKRQTVAYERTIDGRSQVAFRDLGHGERLASAYGSKHGNGDSHHPVIGNSGYYITFESEASNLGTTSLRRQYDTNGDPDVYLWTDVRDMTLLQSVREKGYSMNGGGRKPDMSFYANYVVFHAAYPLASNGQPQVWMRYLGPA